MPLWIHSFSSTSADYVSAVHREYFLNCKHCNAELESWVLATDEDRMATVGDKKDRGIASNQQDSDRMKLCPQCGWWQRSRHSYYTDFEHRYQKETWAASVGVLKSFSLDDIRTPLTEARAYLTARYSSRFDIHPRLLEQTVESIFKSLGYQTELTAYAKDGGIDVILRKGNSAIGVQVKRYRDKIGVAQIRELIGALTLTPSLRSGMFVTVSSFTGGAIEAAAKASSLGVAVELVDADSFFDKLRLAQSADAQETISLAKTSALSAPLTIVYETTGDRGSMYS